MTAAAIAATTPTTPGNARSATRTPTRRRTAGSMFQAASKISGGSSTKSTVSPKWNGRAIGWIAASRRSEHDQRDDVGDPQPFGTDRDQNRRTEQRGQGSGRPGDPAHRHGRETRAIQRPRWRVVSSRVRRKGHESQEKWMTVHA